ncbi:MAG: tRNA-intron lyase, partial [Nanoarchaeota archaeon]|nr:tRNA-intron lyase [Nanoarchaeota archaeon]
MAKKKTKKSAKIKPSAETEQAPKKEIIQAMMMDERVITEASDPSRELYNQGVYGIIKEGKVQLSLIEALYLAQKGKIEIRSESNRKIELDKFITKARKLEPNFWIRYCVFKDIRNRGYVIKTALKFGADFRVYDRGIKPGEDHAKWIVYPVHESSALTWYEFAAKNRVA